MIEYVQKNNCVHRDNCKESNGDYFRRRKGQIYCRKSNEELEFHLIVASGTVERLYHRVDRVLGFLSSRTNWDSPNPQTLTPQRECYPPGTKGVAILACRWGGGGGAKSDDWRESVALCLLCERDVIIIRWQATDYSICEGDVHIFDRGYPIFPTNGFILNKTIWCWGQISKTYISPSVINNVSGYLFVLSDTPSKEELRDQDHGKRSSSSSQPYKAQSTLFSALSS